MSESDRSSVGACLHLSPGVASPLSVTGIDLFFDFCYRRDLCYGSVQIVEFQLLLKLFRLFSLKVCLFSEIYLCVRITGRNQQLTRMYVESVQI